MFDQDKVEFVQLPIQIQGKFRGSIEISVDDLADDAKVRQMVLETDVAKKWIDNHDNIVKTIIPDSRRMIGFVMKQHKKTK